MAILDVIINESTEQEKNHDNDFIAELAKGYLELEITEKKETLKGYIDSYQKIDDKDSFNAHYLKILIDMLKDEIKEGKEILFSH